MSRPQDVSLADVPCTKEHSADILKMFHSAIEKVGKEHGNKTRLTEKELTKLIHNWETQRDILCLYVRWAKQLKHNFNLDSIATLLCLSRQCGYTPVDFLRKVKTLSIHKHQKAAYGVTFHFDIPNRKDIDRQRLEKEFLGLSVALTLLQEQVSGSSIVMGRKTEDGNDKQPAQLMTNPVSELVPSTQASLQNRIWNSINHRWLALYLLEHLFREANLPWSYTDAMVYSFQMMAPCGSGRFEFLAPLAGFCLRFHSEEAIESKRTRLREIWKDPSSFLSFGNTYLTQLSKEDQSRTIISCFQDLGSFLSSNHKQLSYNRDCSLLKRWTILRAYVFHLWLKAASNTTLKSIVMSHSHGNTRKEKRKVDGCCDAFPTLGIPVQAQAEQEQKKHQVSRKSEKGFQSIISSRQPSSTTSHEEPAAVHMNSKVGDETTIKDTNWNQLRLISLEELQSFAQSYLLIHRLDGVDILSELSPLEVYSADQLHDLKHSRLSGKPPYFPTGKMSPIRLHISTDADCFIDTYAKSFHIAREHSKYFLENVHHLPSLHQIQVLCQAIASHGYMDNKRAKGQYRVNMGCGGQNWVNGAPCKLHGMKFQKAIEKEGVYDSAQLLRTIGQLTEFTWLVTCGLQKEAMDHPIAPDTYRKGLYAAHLNLYLGMDQDVGFEDLTLVVSSLHPVIHEVLEHKDVMNDTLVGYTRTATFNMVLIDTNEMTPTILHFQVLCNFRKVIGQYLGKAPIHYIPADPLLTYYASDFGQELRSDQSKPVHFKGRKSQTSGNDRSFTNHYNTTNETLPHPSMRMADFYIGSCAKYHKFKSIFVLGDAESAVSTESCNNIEDYQSGIFLYKHLQKLVLSCNQSSSLLPSMGAACYHMDSEQNYGQVTFFPGHLDKPFVYNACFVPLGYASFFTVVAVPDLCDLSQDLQSLLAFEEWLERLSNDDTNRVNEFLRLFDVQAKQHNSNQSQRRLVYLNKLGSVLSFPANRYYHATITPKKPKGYPRDMFVFHPLDGTRS